MKPSPTGKLCDFPQRAVYQKKLLFLEQFGVGFARTGTGPLPGGLPTSELPHAFHSKIFASWKRRGTRANLKQPKNTAKHK